MYFEIWNLYQSLILFLLELKNQHNILFHLLIDTYSFYQHLHLYEQIISLFLEEDNCLHCLNQYQEMLTTLIKCSAIVINVSNAEIFVYSVVLFCWCVKSIIKGFYHFPQLPLFPSVSVFLNKITKKIKKSCINLQNNPHHTWQMQKYTLLLYIYSIKG